MHFCIVCKNRRTHLVSRYIEDPGSDDTITTNTITTTAGSIILSWTCQAIASTAVLKQCPRNTWHDYESSPSRGPACKRNVADSPPQCRKCVANVNGCGPQLKVTTVSGRFPLAMDANVKRLLFYFYYDTPAISTYTPITVE